MGIQEEQHHVASYIGSLDGDGAADHDQAYRFGWRPRASAPYPRAPRSEAERGFNTRQFVRLLVMRSRVHDHPGRESEDVATPRSAALHGAGSWPKVAA